jgi:hypothetical protein
MESIGDFDQERRVAVAACAMGEDQTVLGFCVLMKKTANARSLERCGSRSC